MLLMPVAAICGDPELDQVTYNGHAYPLFPEVITEAPEIPSPLLTKDGEEIVTCFTRDGSYFLIPVTIENGEPLDYASNQWWGKGNQLAVDSLDFPTLARTGLHSTAELDRTESITGRPVAEITRIGRPDAHSQAGFMGAREDIVSVLKGDNDLVRQLRLTHPQCATPLFRVFNLILAVKKDSERANVGGILYNGRRVLLGFGGAKGWQESIFDDEILGYWQIELQRELDPEEKSFLAKRYADLSDEGMAALIEKLSYIHTGEMVPYYIMRYGFYEGHTSYRADPIAIASVFGLRSLEEIESAFDGSLHEVLTTHFTGESTLSRPD
jgi:hypothetical protein